MLTKDVPAVCWINTDFCSAVNRPLSDELTSHVEFLFNGIFLSLQMVTL